MTIYDMEATRPPMLTDAQEQSLVARAHSGDAQAREEMILSLQGWVQHCAITYHATYGWRFPFLEVCELEQIANLAMLEKVERALSIDRPFAYLQVTARAAIKYLFFPPHPLHTYSLDVPLSPSTRHTFADLLAAPTLSPTTEADEEQRDYTPLYQAIETVLTDQQRELITRHFGLQEQEPESLSEIARSWYSCKRKACGAVFKHRDNALAALRRVLPPMLVGGER